MIIEDKLLDCIIKRKDDLETPLYLYSADQLDLAAGQLLNLFPDGSRLFYSLKANPQPGIVKHFAQQGIYPEVASVGERRMCLQTGVAAEKILVGGVSKSSHYLAEVCDSGCFALVLDSLSEWRRLKTVIANGLQPNVLLRVAPGVPLGGLDMAGSSQFGLSCEQAVRIAYECNSGSAVFRGLHFYFGSQRLEAEPVLNALQIVVKTIRAFETEGLEVSVVDVGLGCGVPYLEKDEALDYDALGEQLQPIWANSVWDGIEICSEAGRALAGKAGYYVTRVTEVKQLHGKTFVFLDGGINAHNPGAALGRLLPGNPGFLYVTRARSDARIPMTFVGNLCTSTDLLGQDVEAPELNEGDLVVIPNSGAYMQTTGMWGFNSQRPCVEMLLQSDGVLKTLEPQYKLWLQAYCPGSSV